MVIFATDKTMEELLMSTENDFKEEKKKTELALFESDAQNPIPSIWYT